MNPFGDYFKQLTVCHILKSEVISLLESDVWQKTINV
jgi:hypothetical protein